MRVCLNLDPSRLLRWHLWTANDIAETPGNEVFRTFSTGRHPLPSACRLLFEFERLLYGTGRDGAADPMEDELRSLPPRPPGEIDVVIDFSGEDRRQTGCRVLTPFFNGTPGEIGIMAALVNDQELVVELHDSARPSRPWTARPASTDREVFSKSIDGVLSCASALIIKAVHEVSIATAPVPTVPDAPAPSFVGLTAVARAMGGVASKAVKLLDAMARGGRTWAIGWRLDESTSLLDKREGTFRVLTGGTAQLYRRSVSVPASGARLHLLRAVSLCNSKGVHLDRDRGAERHRRCPPDRPGGATSSFLSVRVRACGPDMDDPEIGRGQERLSLQSGGISVPLEREACLAEGIEVYDTTPLRCRDDFWFFACLRSRKSSSWDMLRDYRANGLTGSWTPHADNPVAIDARLSRPAAPSSEQTGQILRPVQDCARGYGSGVTFCRLDALEQFNVRTDPGGTHRVRPILVSHLRSTI